MLKDLPHEILFEIVKFHIKPSLKLRDWVNMVWDRYKGDPRLGNNFIHIIKQSNYNAVEWIKSLEPEKICWSIVCRNQNPDIIPFIRENISKLKSIDWYTLALNENAIDILQQYPDKYLGYICGNKKAISLIQNHIDNGYSKNWNRENWNTLSSNEEAIPILENYIDKIDWFYLSYNKNAMSILKKYPEKINWHSMSQNRNPETIDFLLQYPDKIDWNYLSLNDSDEAVEFLLQHQDKINWDSFSSNENEKAIAFLENNIDKINWRFLTVNKGAVKILEKHLDKINWNDLYKNENAIHIIENNLERIVNNIYNIIHIGSNPNIFEIDIEKTNKEYLDFVNILKH